MLASAARASASRSLPVGIYGREDQKPRVHGAPVRRADGDPLGIVCRSREAPKEGGANLNGLRPLGSITQGRHATRSRIAHLHHPQTRVRTRFSRRRSVLGASSLSLRDSDDAQSGAYDYARRFGTRTQWVAFCERGPLLMTPCGGVSSDQPAFNGRNRSEYRTPRMNDPIDRKLGLSWKPGVAAKSLAATPDFLPLGEPRPFGVNVPGADVAQTAQ